MNYSIVLTETAQTDLSTIFRYIAVELQSVQNANAQLSRIEKQSRLSANCRSITVYMTGKVGVTFRGCAVFFLRNLLYLIRNLLYFIYLRRGILCLAEDFRIKRDMTLTV